ncbi:hypothetical protein ABPG72_010616 [Tetrahymena utriculariae]
MHSSQTSASSINLPKIQQSQSALNSPAERINFMISGHQSVRSQESTVANSMLHHDFSQMRSYSCVKKDKWDNKFKLLEVRRELRYTSNSAKSTKHLMQSISPQLSSKSAFKQQISLWGKESSAFKQSVFFNDKEMEKHLAQEIEKLEDEQHEQGIWKKIDESFENPAEDNNQKIIIGDEAADNYYKHYKKLDKVQQQNKFFEIQDSTFTSILTASQKKMVTPCKIGLIKTKGSEEDLIIKNMKYGDQYAEVLSEGMRRVPHIQNFYMSGNRITNKGADDLLKTISKKARVLELAENQIGKIGCEHISRALYDRDSKIEILNLEGNKLGDAAVSLILNSLNNNKILMILNLSKNYLTDKSAEKLGSLLDTDYYLKELYLHWNQIKAPGGAFIFTSLTDNESLKVLDMSCNSMGSGGSCVEEVCNFLVKNVEMRHLDISNNYFNIESSLKISEALVKNKTIYGFHYSGNAGYIDSRGFLIVNENQQQDLTGIHVKKRINGNKALSQFILRNNRDIDLQDCCWICEGWNEQTIAWEQDKSGEGVPDPLFIHFNFENYRSNYTGKPTSSTIEYKRMYPPGHLYYFFTLDETVCVDKQDSQKLALNPEGKQITSIMQYDGKLVDADLDQLNKIDIKKNENVLDENYNPTISIQPRTADPIYIPAKTKKKRVKWTFPISLFTKWRPDDDEIIKKCFEYDWDNCKIQQKVKKQEDQDQLKEFLRSKYKHIKETYKHFASLAPIQDIWCIQNGPWLELISLINIIDSKVKDADINLKWTATISGGDKSNYRNPERGINRHQLMEALVRIAEEKYILKYGKVNTFYEATKMLWEEHLESLFVEKYNQHKWRVEQYWIEEIDLCLKNYKKIIDHIYKKFAKLKVKPGQPPFMCLEELNKIVTVAGLLEDEHFGSSVANMAFNFSMMTQIDELQNDRIFQMSQVEFYEALTRIAQEACLIVGPGIYPADYEWTWEKRQQQSLAYKLEGLVLRLLDTVCDSSFKAQYPKIEKSFFVKVDDSEEYED